MGIPMLPKKLPSRNWMIFWALTGSLAGAIIYDKREKKRATARWARAVSHLAAEPLRNPNEMPRKVTVFLESPPGDGLRAAQDHFIEYVRPVLAASGLDWEFVQGRQQGDVRAAVAERIRRGRKQVERPEEEVLPTNDKAILDSRKRSGIAEYDGVKGDLVVGRHTWKEYIRGLHEGWLGPLDPPALPEPPKAPEAEVAQQESKDAASPEAPKVSALEAAPQESTDGDNKAEEKTEEKKEEEKEKKPERPPQPPSYNSPHDYAASTIPPQIPAEFQPSSPIEFPHILGFTATPRRFWWFLNRRKLADSIGRDVAAVCFAAAAPWGEGDPQLGALKHEEAYWPGSVFEPLENDGGEKKEPAKEKVWPVPVVADERIVGRMRRFEVLEEAQRRAEGAVVPEAEIEGWIKGSLRQLWRWGAAGLAGKRWSPNVGDIDKEE